LDVQKKKTMRKFFAVIARFIAAIFSILFVITSILALFFTTINRQMFNTSLYKNVLVEQNIYERLPGILGKMITTSLSSNPCTKNPVTCENISPDLKACYEQAVGNERYITLASGKDQPTEAEQAQIQTCLDQSNTPAQTVTLGSSESPGQIHPSNIDLSPSNWETLIKLILPPRDLQTMAESTLDQMVAYFGGETDTVVFSLVQFKERLNGQAGADAIKHLILTQPNCTLDYLLQMTGNLLGGGGKLVLCNPGMDLLNVVMPLFQRVVNAVATNIPSTIVIIKPASAGSPPLGTGPLGEDRITTIRTLRLTARLSPLLPLVFLLLVTILAVHSLKSWMLWWGIPVFISGAIALCLGILAKPALNTAWSMYIVPRIPPFIPAELAHIGLELLSYIVHAITEEVILCAIIMLALGLALWIGSYFIKTKNKPSLPFAHPTMAS
jgi:hypothetical protein